MKFTIITPTTGSNHLVKLLESVNMLVINDNIDILHCVVIDGRKFEYNSMHILNSIKPNTNHNRSITCLDFNTGGTGFLGHKIYA